MLEVELKSLNEEVLKLMQKYQIADTEHKELIGKEIMNVRENIMRLRSAIEFNEERKEGR